MQQGVRGVLGAGISGLKNMIFESDVEIPYEVQAQGVDIFRRAGMKAELAFLDQQVADANKKLRDDKQFDKQVKVPTTISQKVMMAVKRPNQSLEEGKGDGHQQTHACGYDHALDDDAPEGLGQVFCVVRQCKAFCV